MFTRRCCSWPWSLHWQRSRRHNACAQNRVALFRCLPSAYTSFASVCHHDCFRSLVVSLIHSRLDHGNFVLVGLPAYLQRHLQSVLNAAARLVFRLRRYDHITDALATLHWLLLPERVDFKIAVMTFRVLHGLLRHIWISWFTSPISLVAVVIIIPATRSDIPSCNRRPSFISRCCIYPLELVTDLPPDVQSSASLSVFRQRLKTKDSPVSQIISRLITLNDLFVRRLRYRGLRRNICYCSHVNNFWLTLTLSHWHYYVKEQNSRVHRDDNTV